MTHTQNMTEQHWTPDRPCTYCGADSNTSHPPTCPNHGLYTADGAPIPAVRVITEARVIAASIEAGGLGSIEVVKRQNDGD